MNSFVNLLHSNGRYVLNSVAARLPDSDFGMEWIKRFQHSLSLQCFSLSSFTTEDLRTASGKLFALAAENKIKLLVDRIFTLEEAVEAHIYLKSGEAFGKIDLNK